MKIRIITLIALSAIGAWAQNVNFGHSANTIEPGVTAGTIGGGGSANQPNRVTDRWGTVGGGRGNWAGDNAGNTSTAYFSTVAGGRDNRVMDRYGFIGGGFQNRVQENYGVIPGGRSNQITVGSSFSAIGGGRDNMVINATFGAIGGGQDNEIDDSNYAGIGGGRDNAIEPSSSYSFIGGGRMNMIGPAAGSAYSAIGGGESNVINGGFGVIGGGKGNMIGMNGTHAVIPGGENNATDGDHSFAAGNGASAMHDNSFVWSGLAGGIASAGNGHFVVGAQKVWFGTTGAAQYNAGEFISTSTGAFLSDGGAWTDASSRELKENFQAVNAEAVLEKLMKLPILEWNYTNQPDTIRHLGPMAEDFHALFGLGPDDRSISGVDRSGVGFAAVQALARRVQEREKASAANQAEIERNAKSLKQQQARLEALERRLQALETR